jgi:hypothetical protein
MAVLVQFQMRNATDANWTSDNPVLLAAEMGFATTSLRFKVGDGVTAWNSLPWQQNTIFNGAGAPSNSLGVIGDVYFDSTNKGYQVKTGVSTWSALVSLQGAQGTAGAPGSAGAGVVAGGTAGQFLRKIDSTNYNTVWQDIPGGYVTLAMQVNAAANTLRGNNTGGAATVADLTPTQVAAMLPASTQSLQGLMSALDKRLIDNLHYDFVADFGGVGNDSTLNDTQFANAISTMPAGAVLFIPAGTYRISAAIDINVDRRYTFKGVNRYASIIKTTNATQHTFTKSVAGWYDMWTDIGFQTSVTKTAGAAINIPVGNNVGMNVYRCAFSGMFQAINATGNQSANLSVWSDLDISSVPNGGRGIFINGATINVMIHNATINAGAATTSACCEIQASGAVQVTNCDWIQGTNVVWFNAASALGAQACYFTNCFFDQPQGSVIKITGGFTSNRIKFTQCGIAATGANHSVEINGTGAGGVGTATALPAGISLVDCDIYNAAGTGTGAGILVNGAQDVNIQACRVTGFNGVGGAGVRIIPSASNQTKVRINGCIFGPNSNLTVTNATHVDIQAGTSGLGALSVGDNQMDGASVAPLADASAAVVGVSKRISQNSGLMSGTGILQLLGSTGSAVIAGRGAVTSGTSETIMAVVRIPANSVVVGQTFLIKAELQASSTGTVIVGIRAGTAGTVGGDTTLLWASNVSAAAVANQIYYVDAVVQVVALGASSTLVAHGQVTSQAVATAGTSAVIYSKAPAAEVVGSIPTTALFYIDLTATTTIGTLTARQILVEAV